jgi:hypothetical protein
LDDPIIEDLHRVRRELAAEFNDDVHAFFEHLREREAKRPDRAVTLEPFAPEVASSTGEEDGCKQ